MKNLRLLALPLAGFLLFTIGLLLPLQYAIVHYILIVLGLSLTVVFYFLTLIPVIRKFSANSYKSVFWVIAIICVPVVGNIIYVIFMETANRRQQPKPESVW